MTSGPTAKEFESLFVNNEQLSQIEAYLNKFNPIRTMKMERMEIRHSAILAWLLDPTETHGLDDGFLKAFLGEALREHDKPEGPTALDVSQASLRDAEVRCEWQNIDIFIFCPTHRWAFIIENKYDSWQHDGQLSKYVAKVSDIYGSRSKDLLVRGVFLTLRDEKPADQNYVSIRYSAICSILTQIIQQRRHVLSDEVITFLVHYLDILEEATGMSLEQQKMIQLARALYREHRRVLDFVVEHGAGSDFAVAARSLFGDEPERFSACVIDEASYTFGSLNNRTVSFLPERWFTSLSAAGETWAPAGWWMDRALIVWLEVVDQNEGAKGQVRLQAEVGPVRSVDARRRLIHGISNIASTTSSKRIAFRKNAADEGRMYSKFLKDNSVYVDDIQDAEQLADGMNDLLRKFQSEFDAIAEGLPSILREPATT